MADSQDIFMLLLIILFMANNNSDTNSINSTILMMLLFGSIRNGTDTASSGCGCGTCGNARIAAPNACRCCNC